MPLTLHISSLSSSVSVWLHALDSANRATSRARALSEGRAGTLQSLSVSQFSFSAFLSLFAPRYELVAAGHLLCVASSSKGLFSQAALLYRPKGRTVCCTMVGTRAAQLRLA